MTQESDIAQGSTHLTRSRLRISDVLGENHLRACPGCSRVISGNL